MHFQSQIITQRDSAERLSDKIIKSIFSEETTLNLNQFNFNDIRSEEGKNSIGIKEIEDLKEWAYKKSENIRFAVVYEAEKMTREAQNSILKVLEEPGENTIIILVTKNENLLLETIRSRCKILKEASSNVKVQATEFARWFIAKETGVPSSKEFQKRIDDLPTANLQEVVEAIRNEIVSEFMAKENLQGIENMIELLEILELALQNNASNKIISSTLHTYLAKKNLS